MEEVVRTRLKLIFQNLTSLIGKNQKELEIIQRGETTDIIKAEILSNKLKAALERFVSETYNYFKVVNEPCADEVSQFTQVQLRGEELATELDYYIGKKNAAPSESRPNTREKEVHVASKLPKMELAKFDGDVLKWHQFWDQFASNVDSRNINDVDKLLYLQSVLEGEAKRAIDGLDTTNKNYQIAVSTLKDRYGKPSTIIDAHYAALYRVKTADKSISECRRTLNEIERHLRVLDSLGEDVNHNHLRVMIMQKFSEEIIYELRVKLGTETDTIADIRTQLEHIISAREASSRIKQVTRMPEQPTTSGTENEKFTLETLHTASEVHPKPRQFSNRPFQHQNNQRGRVLRTRGIDRRVGYRTPFQINNKNRDTRKRQYNTEDHERKEPDTKKKKPTCIFCGNGHFNDECRVVKTVQERKNKLGGRCYNCLAKGHQTKDCKSNKNCRHCGKYGNHNRALCPTRDAIKTDALHARNPINKKEFTFLQTAITNIGKVNQTPQTPCRILLDCGSQRTYITRVLAEKLNLPELERNYLSVFTFGADHPSEIESPLVNFEMLTKTNNRMIVHANVVPHITKDVPTLPHDATLHIRKSDPRLKTIVMADDASLGNQVDILIGNDYYFSFINGEKIQISDNLYLVNSVFGWVWSGRSAENNASNGRDQLSVVTYFQSSIECSSFCEPDLPLKNDNIKRLWDLESIGITDSPKAERDDEAVKQFNETIKFFDNRYHVKWPWIEYPPLLPTNYGLSLGRLKTLLRRLDDATVLSYDNIIKEQLYKNIIEEVPKLSDSDEAHPVHYLPHHCISQGGKLRLVYDASSKTKDNKSLNECLYRGPLLLEDLTGLLLRFREHRIGVVSDVKKAFLQIELQTADRDVTRFLWLKNVREELSEENPVHLRFQRVPFGVISSPFLLNATILNHLNKSNDKVHAHIAQDIYVDNLVTGVDCIEEAMNLYQISKRAFDELSMNLREWNSNSDEFIDSIPPLYRSKETEHMKVLGLNWNRINDSLSLRFNLADKDLDKINTKREVLRLVASIFDPCGFSVPLVLPAKLFLQDLWHQKVEWDTKLDEIAQEELKMVIESLSHIKDIEIPRLFNDLKYAQEHTVHHELHAFTDASMQAYAAAVYLRSVSDEDIRLSFVIGKSRLVERAKQTDLQIPKLELLGALIGKRLLKITMKALRLPVTKLYLWTDNQIVISWCNSEKLLPPFVAKRVEEIKQDNVCMRYVPTQMNPADVATRTKASQEDVSRWLSGPDFLHHGQSKWPANVSASKSLRHEQIHNLSVGQGPTEVQQQSQDFNRSNQLSTESGLNMDQSSETVSHQSTLRCVQKECFPKESEGKETDLTRSLGVYMDDEGILRCGGRLKNTVWTESQKNPILLPRNHDFTSKVIEETHKTNYHVGVSHTLALIRQKYWIPQGRSQVQKTLRQCLSCRKYAGGPFKMPPMAQLPIERVTYSNAFTHSGVDYFGPLLVKVSGTSVKRWVALYTCLAVRAIHMEVVADLTAEECLLALRRFVASRGVPKTISSDNALQFKLTADVLTNQYCITNNIKWKFIPELAPWFGGYYERLIGIVKNCLKKTLDKHLLNDPQLHTVIKEIEAVVNSRPLTVVGNEIEHILTPADFLRIGGASMPAASDHEFLEPATVTKSNLIDSWKRGQRILQEYIQIFSNQYLNSLRDRRIMHRQARVVVDAIPKVGDIVQIKGDSNRALWKVGKISAVIRGKDGKVRVARVTTSPKETLTRSIAHLYPLEIQELPKSHNASEGTTPQTDENMPHETSPPLDSQGDDQATKHQTQKPQIDFLGNDAQATSNSPDQVPASAQTESNRLRPKRLSAQKAREKMKDWTTQLLSVLRSDFSTVDLIDLTL